MQSHDKELLDQLLTYTPICHEVYRRRVGKLGDGGYVVLGPHFESTERFYSYGINDDFSFDSELQRLTGALGRLFDPNVHYPEILSKGLHFQKIGLGRDDGSVSDHVWSYGDTGKKMLLKVDVEGAEWDWLKTANDTELRLFEQICVELHFVPDPARFSTYADCLRRLNRHFYLFHVHCNNALPLKIVGPDRLLPQLLECSYVRKDICDCKPNTSVRFPVAGIDWPCVASAPEDNLDFWPFITGQETEAEQRAVTEAMKRAAMRAQLAEDAKRIASLEFELRNLKQSSYWKLGAPIRTLSSLLRNR